MIDARTEFSRALTGLVGSCLEQVCYRSLPRLDEGGADGDATDGQIEALLEEVKLRFDSSRVAFVTWGQGRGWPGDCSLIVSKETLAKPPNAYTETDASKVPLWVSHIDQLLGKVQVLGWDDTPYVLRLAFSSGSVLVGTGRDELDAYGDGLDVFVRPNEARYLQDAQLLWEETS